MRLGIQTQVVPSGWPYATSRSQMGGGIKDYWDSLRNLPQTQQDIRTLARTAEEVRSPAVKKQVQELKEDVEDLGKTILVIQAIGTLAMVGMLVIQLRK